MITTAPHGNQITITAGEINRRWRAAEKRADELAGALHSFNSRSTEGCGLRLSG